MPSAAEFLDAQDAPPDAAPAQGGKAADFLDSTPAPPKPQPIDTSSFTPEQWIDLAKKYRPVQGPPLPKPDYGAPFEALAKTGPEIVKQRALEAAGHSPLELAGLTPEGIGTAYDYYTGMIPEKFRGPVKAATAPIQAVDKTISGLADWSTSASGKAQLEAAGVPVARIPMAIKFFHDMAMGGSQSASDTMDAFNRGDMQGTVDGFINTLANFAGAGALGFHITPKPKGGPNAIRQQSGKPVPKLEVRPQVGQETPLRQPDQEPAPAQAPVAQTPQVPLKPFKVEATEDGRWVVTNPAGGEESIPITSLNDAKVVADTLNRRSKNPERIVAAAINHPALGPHTGPHHPSILEKLGIGGFEDKESRNTPMFGYLTDRGRFVNREEAKPIVEKSGQNLDNFEQDPHSDKVENTEKPGTAIGDKPVTVTEDNIDNLEPERYKQMKHGDGIEYGLTLGPQDEARIQAKYEESGREMKAAGTDQAALDRAFGKNIFYGGALMGLTRGRHPISGINYSRFIADHPELDPKLKEAAPAPSDERPPSPATPAEVAGAGTPQTGITEGLSPEEQRMVDIERGNVDTPVDVVNDVPTGEEPFAKGLKASFLRNVATINRKAGRILINRKNFQEWLGSIPQSQQALAIRSLISEERIHLATTDAQALAYWNSLTGLEKAIVKRRYGRVEQNDVMWGHEALRFRLQQLSRMTPREIAEASGLERWTLKGLTAVEGMIRGLREQFAHNPDIVNILDKIQENLRLGKVVAGASPEESEKAVQQASVAQSQAIDSQAKMFAESGDTAAANELADRARQLRHESGGESFPGARKKTRHESIWQEKFTLPGMETQKVKSIMDVSTGEVSGGSTQPLPGHEMAPEVAPELRAPPEGGAPLARLNARQLEARGVLWLRKMGRDVLKAFNEGKHVGLPSFAGFAKFMNAQGMNISRSHLAEMWATNVNRMLDNATGEQLSALFRAAQTGKRLEGAKVYSETARGRSSLLRGIVTGTQTVMDKPVQGTVPTELGFEAGRAGAPVSPETWDWINADPKRRAAYEATKPSYKMVRKGPGAPRVPERSLPAQKSTETELGFGTSGGKVNVSPDQAAWLEGERQRIALGQLNQEELEVQNRQTREREAEKKSLLEKEAKGNLKPEEKDRLEQIRRNEELVKNKPALRETVESNRIYQDKQLVKRMLRRRNAIIGALAKRMLASVAPPEIAQVKHMSPEDIRYGGGRLISSVQDFDQNAENNPELLGWELVDDSRRDKRDPVTATKRVTAIVDRKTGDTWLVSTYRNAELNATMLMDPLSPRGQHGKLQDMLSRYRVIGSVLRDTPVQGFKEHFKNLADFNDSFWEEAKGRYNAETSYDPRNVPIDEFIEATGGGRMIETEESGFEGTFPTQVEKPGSTARLSGEGGMGAIEKGRHTPITDAEANAVIKHIFREQGSIEDVDDVKEAMVALGELMGRRGKLTAESEHTQPYMQALSGFRKIARAVQIRYPHASEQEVLDKTASAIYDNWKNLESFRKFTAVTMEEGGAKTGPAPEPAPATETGRELTLPYSRKEAADIRTGYRIKRAAGVIGKPQVPEESYPGAYLKPKIPNATPEQKADEALSDSLYRLNNQYVGDVEDAIPDIRSKLKERKQLPEDMPDLVYRKLEEEAVLKKSDVALPANYQAEYERDAQLWAENNVLRQRAHENDPDSVKDLEYWPRMAREPNNLFERMIRGIKQGVLEGGILGKSAWFTRPRTIKALVDDQGNRVVGIIHNDKFIAYNKGKSADLGAFKWTDVVPRKFLLDKELAELNKEFAELQTEQKIFQRSERYEEVAARRLKNIDKRMAEIFDEADAITARYPEGTDANRTWVDKNGKQWRVTEATTGEIEDHMKTRYVKDPYALLLAQNINLKKIVRAQDWLENFKKTPLFARVARKAGEPGIPPEWVDYASRRKLQVPPQLRGYVFEPRVADVLDQFEQMRKGREANILTATNKLLMNAVFFDNPFLHSPNLMNWWFTSRGAFAWFNPVAYPRMIKTGAKALNDVITKSQDYVNYLRAGTPLQNTRMREFTDNITSMVQKELDSNPTLGRRLSNFLGYANPIKLSQSLGHAATTGLHDILTLQLIYEAQLRDPSLKPHEAIRKVSAVMPDYRIKARVLGSRWISKVVSNPNAVWFGAYHYSEGKAFMNMAKGLVGKGQFAERGKVKGMGEALDKIAAIGFLMAVAYPVMDQILKEVTGKKNLMFRRAGATTIPTAVLDLLAKNRTPEQVIPSILTPASATMAAVSLLTNRNVMFGGRGLPIYNWREGAVQSAGKVAGFLAQSLNPMQVYRDITSGRYNWDQIFENMAGIRKDYSTEYGTRVYGWAYDWAKRTNNQQLLDQFQRRSMEVYPPSQYERLKNYLADGDMRKAHAEYYRMVYSFTDPDLQEKKKKEIERELRPSTHPLSGLTHTEDAFKASLAPYQRQVYNQVMGRREQIYNNYLTLAGQ